MEATGSAELRDVYEEQYSADGDDAARYGRWRALCAEGKADHVVRLAGRAGPPARDAWPRWAAATACCCS